MPWEPPELDVDPDAATSRILDALVDRIDLDPVDGDPLVVLAEEIGRETAITNQLMAAFIENAVAGIGETAYLFPAYRGATAWVSVDVTVNAAGDVVPSGFTVVGTNPAGVEVAFTLDTDTISTDTTVPVILHAAETGDVGNGVGPGELVVVTSTSTVVDATATSPSTGGADAEEQTDYLDRLVDYLATLRPGGVRGEDLASLARSVPGVERCLAVDLYDPAAPNTPAERTATVFPIDESSNAVAGQVATQVQEILEAAREVNFIIHVAAPTYTRVQVQYAAVADRGADPAVVVARIDAAVLAWLARWGTVPGDDTAWVSVPVVRYLELARVAGGVDGVDHLTTLTINGQAADLQLNGAAALPTPPSAASAPSTCTGTVSLP